MSELRSFLGLANFVGGYIPNFSEATRPLWDCVKETKHFVWGHDQEESFQSIKRSIIDCTITLGPFNDKDQTFLYTDASGVAIGAVLTQLSH